VRKDTTNKKAQVKKLALKIDSLMNF